MADPGFPIGGCAPLWGAMDLQCGCFLVKMYAKMKELGPIGGGMCPAHPPRSTNDNHLNITKLDVLNVLLQSHVVRWGGAWWGLAGVCLYATTLQQFQTPTGMIYPKDILSRIGYTQHRILG